MLSRHALRGSARRIQLVMKVSTVVTESHRLSGGTLQAPFSVFRGACTTDFCTTCTTNIGRSGAAEPPGITFQGDAWVQKKRDSPLPRRSRNRRYAPSGEVRPAPTSHADEAFCVGACCPRPTSATGARPECSRLCASVSTVRAFSIEECCDSTSADERQEHDGRFARGETVRRAGLHV